MTRSNGAKPETGTHAYDIVGFGEASVDDVWLLPPALGLGGKGRARERHRIGGGQVATALVAAARLGAHAAYLGPIGDDELGTEIANGLIGERVDVLSERSGRSRVALVLVAPDGERTVIEDGGVAGMLPTLPPARALHVDGTQAAAIELCEEARDRGVLVSVDLDLAADIGRARALAGLADLCVVAEGMGALPTRPDAFVVETLGVRGVRWSERIVPSFEVRVVDTTACGDTLRGALVVAWLEGRRGVDALRFANAAAALKCSDVGRRGCPTREAVDALLGRAPT